MPVLDSRSRTPNSNPHTPLYKEIVLSGGSCANKIQNAEQTWTNDMWRECQISIDSWQNERQTRKPPPKAETRLQRPLSTPRQPTVKSNWQGVLQENIHMQQIQNHNISSWKLLQPTQQTSEEQSDVPEDWRHESYTRGDIGPTKTLAFRNPAPQCGSCFF